MSDLFSAAFDGPNGSDESAAEAQDARTSSTGRTRPSAPLAVRMRPRSVDEVVGQQHLLHPGSPLRKLAEGEAPAEPPGRRR